jgi:hypothetical protein
MRPRHFFDARAPSPFHSSYTDNKFYPTDFDQFGEFDDKPDAFSPFRRRMAS